MDNRNEVKSYKWDKLKTSPPVNAVLYVLDESTKDVEVFITDKTGVPRKLKSSEINIGDYVDTTNGSIVIQDNKIFVKKVKSSDGTIIIHENNNSYDLSLQEGAFEITANKQNNLSEDLTNTKYPTVTAVRAAIEQISQITGDKHFVYDQPLPLAIWKFINPLGKGVSVTIVDSAGTEVEGQIYQPGDGTITITFNSPFSGKAYLN